MSTFGSNLKEARLKRGWTLKQLSELSGVSVAMLSKIETGEKIPTIRVAGQISASLSLSISDLVGDNVQPKQCVVIRKEARKRVFNPLTGLEAQLLSPGIPYSGLDLTYATLPPHSSSRLIPPHARGSEEYCIVAEGQLTVILNQTDSYNLHAGDSIFFKADVYHEIQNQTDEECKYYLVFNK
ncbi:MAG: helix-turn-helix domain-containing protein [Veillonellaceae bacterium]|nr:helix-turn-helix domain-containing protein [Veillonellaceae bacterium]